MVAERAHTSMITLYDIPSKLEGPWSNNTWKTRIALNIKRISYETIYVEFPDIEPLYKSLNVPASSTKADGVTPHYTLPMIFDDQTKRYISDSFLIAVYLDETYPDTPQLVPHGTYALHVAFLAHFSSFVNGNVATLIIPTFLSILNPVSSAFVQENYFSSAPIPTPSEEKWKKLEKEVFAKVVAWYKSPDDLFFNGTDKPGFADVQLVASFQWMKALWGADSDEWKRVQGWHGGKWAKSDAAMSRFY